MKFVDRQGKSVDASRSCWRRKRREPITHMARLMERNRAMLELRRRGWTVAELGAAFGLTDRAVQITIKALAECERLARGE